MENVQRIIKRVQLQLRLTAHEFEHIAVGAGLDAAGVHQAEGSAAPLTVAVDPVPGDTGGVFDDGGALTGQLIKQHGFSHIGSANDGNQGFCHVYHFLSMMIQVIMPYFYDKSNRKEQNVFTSRV